jgi:hypothetical protein
MLKQMIKRYLINFSEYKLLRLLNVVIVANFLNTLGKTYI